ncbi:3-methylornithyl-N6-L-lysine dehydrogenase PylD [Desulfosarcina sp.]|uniref:3-methylornithyl-N6-L-lysine dehydrogenase PylD n=1 Tax=Desulfosarcina sp. TaxID=2027861 RepID=UPI0029A52AE6|nr:3-methylornithyl-N6-L-lysine dehydrogenase PylD [Desulfosarcina sp.]MDX2452334.1 3-methylornithyl-N6-L-lysine dehydrogenase PylD [Desulfosarcina sp.]MDX2490114.1 3-methylornithyl-N6-L-lysine dehydrogenase PylD [Desulfosarcina sp.]
MTRLTVDDIEGIRAQLVQYDRQLVSVTGRTLLGIGAWASGLEDEGHLQRLAPGIKMAVVPIHSGLGVISGFAEAVCGILLHLGFDAMIPGCSDVAGFAYALDMGAQVILAADDERFVAFCPRQGKTVDNSRATANGFVAGLDLMAGGLNGKGVLVIGCGPVGRWAVEVLLKRKSRVCVVDQAAEKAENLSRWARSAFQTDLQVGPDLEQALSTHHLIVDATNATEVIHARHVTANTHVAAPGMPIGVTPRAREKLADRILHDPLQIGVATMACQAARIVHERPVSLNPTAHHGGSE